MQPPQIINRWHDGRLTPSSGHLVTASHDRAVAVDVRRRYVRGAIVHQRQRRRYLALYGLELAVGYQLAQVILIIAAVLYVRIGAVAKALQHSISVVFVNAHVGPAEGAHEVLMPARTSVMALLDGERERAVEVTPHQPCVVGTHKGQLALKSAGVEPLLALTPYGNGKVVAVHRVTLPRLTGLALGGLKNYYILIFHIYIN